MNSDSRYHLNVQTPAPASNGPPYVPVPHLKDWIESEWLPNPMQNGYHNRSPTEFVLCNIVRNSPTASSPIPPPYEGFLRAGHREKIFFNPKEVKVAIVTCGGLCPGMNSVIRELAITLRRHYGVEDVWGVQYGYEGFYNPTYPHIKLTAEIIRYLHDMGGTILGSSRGGFEGEKIIDGMLEKGYNLVFVIGGDGTHKGAQALCEIVKQRKLAISIVGIPKTIDNDIPLIDRSFGFDTAVAEAQRALACAAVEADCAINGVCIVQLMGRNSGFVAAHATLASRLIDVCLIPEAKFDPAKLIDHVFTLLKKEGRVVICQAEAAGVDYCQQTGEKDKSGNPRLPDVSLWLKSEIVARAKTLQSEINVRIINPSYMIRSIAPHPIDRDYCSTLATYAVHAGMYGWTGVTIGLVHGLYVLLPVALLGTGATRVDPKGSLWIRVLEHTGQPDF